MSSSLPPIDPTAHYPRARLHFTLEVTSPLHVGSGEVESIQTRLDHCRKNGDKDKDRDKDRKYEQLRKALEDAGDYRLMALKLDSESGQHRPYIPGATLKGLLRAELGANLSEADDTIEELFGVVQEISEEDREREGPTHRRRQGRCRFLDSQPATIASFGQRRPPLWHAQRGTLVRSRVSINPITGAARDHHLAFHEMLPVGSQLDFTIEAREISGAALSALTGRLLAATDRAPLRIGAGAALGCGELRLLQLSGKPQLHLEVITQAALQQWLNHPLDQQSPVKLNTCYAAVDPTPETSPEPNTWVQSNSIAVAFDTLSPLLIASGLDRTERDENNKPKPAIWHQDPPQLSPLMSADNRIIIPAGSLRGLIRARCRRILILWLRELWQRKPATRPAEDTDDPAAAANQAGQQADLLLPALFGSTNQASPLRITDAISEKSFSHEQLHQQSFIAVDRFTGGVADGALYQAWATPVGCRFQTRVSLRPGTTLPNWGRLLLALVARDGFAGDLHLGWGKAKGYGRIALSQAGEYTQAMASRGQALPASFSNRLPDDQTLYEALANELSRTETTSEEKSA